MQKKHSIAYLIPAIFTIMLLLPLQFVLDWDIFLLERLFEHGGFAQIAIFGLYAGFVYQKLSKTNSYIKWRKRIWLLFSMVFFAQLILGITADIVFLLSGKLHFPIPAMILAGPAYRFQIGFMPLLFFSTLVLSGPAWCSFLCYFGAVDYAAAGSKKPRKLILKNRNLWKWSVLIVLIAVALLLKLLKAEGNLVNALALAFGLIGILVIVLFSARKRSMIHCSVFCPVGTLVSVGKYLSPFRFRINKNCTECMKCISSCKYDALGVNNIKSKKIGITCTYCGDCLSTCPHNALAYSFLGMSHEKSRAIFLTVVVVLHAVFMAVGRI